MKLLSWNIENLARHLAPTAAVRQLALPSADVDGPSVRGDLAEVLAPLGEAEVVCLQEVRIRPTDGPRVQAMHDALPGYRVQASLARDPKNAGFRGGRAYGVATYVHASLDAQGTTPDWDLEGRVVITELSSLGLAVVNVYAVNGTDKAHWDHTCGRYVGSRHDWKLRFLDRVQEECARLLERGVQLVMLGDWNVSRTAQDTHPRLRSEEPHAGARRRFNEVFLPALDVVDVYRELYPERRQYTWFRRNARWLDAARVDFALVSRSLLPRVVAAGIDDRPETRGHSDHAPLWIALRT